MKRWRPFCWRCFTRGGVHHPLCRNERLRRAQAQGGHARLIPACGVPLVVRGTECILPAGHSGAHRHREPA